MSEQYCTVMEASKKIDVHPKTIRRYIYDGKLSAKKIGRQWRVDEESINEFLNGPSNSCSNCESKDDFCVFMDSDSFESDDLIQICSIVDIFIKDSETLTSILNKINQIITNYDKEEKFKYNYIYDNNLNKTRLIFWGNPKFIKIITNNLEDYL
ncbi:MAG: helix-turn-helix domain-containing protein [Bacillota bacterium]